MKRIISLTLKGFFHRKSLALKEARAIRDKYGLKGWHPRAGLHHYQGNWGWILLSPTGMMSIEPVACSGRRYRVFSLPETGLDFEGYGTNPRTLIKQALVAADNVHQTRTERMRAMIHDAKALDLHR